LLYFTARFRYTCVRNKDRRWMEKWRIRVSEVAGIGAMRRNGVDSQFGSTRVTGGHRAATSPTTALGIIKHLLGMKKYYEKTMENARKHNPNYDSSWPYRSQKCPQIIKRSTSLNFHTYILPPSPIPELDALSELPPQCLQQACIHAQCQL
jgi:hypothetical protein